MSTVELNPSLVTRLETLARSEGVSLEVLIERLASQPAWKEGKLPRLTGDELERLLDAEAASDSTYQGSYSRADIYRDHD
jgi:hypothetical protein